jgi:hypothetical protein
MLVKRVKKYLHMEATPFLQACPGKHECVWSVGKESIVEGIYAFLITNT